ncbi:hypothetical protein CLAFUW4_03400 [Fulvia fulva]|uniref:Uncharacterized protein n=1 Tax=Passalora fulva TaxID=5499 RepID=A0A9Q8LB23_PASFU|nr:uncharacterized protein CLAFUR5_03381 [Fulvia fulva]KAK4632344.1 hypothetical protein CLAFUR4_03389 [Fulvia fulva]KAK4633428.1 hypothetical protein CLAFUR0_03394 [Fulvia fulva]UJO13974.1 hypothetical protein CLAFUR5_03381 [Fulvia fulva]WPV11334.1 hypothetical protein CLAFUW4_03400 [Fulvia fulva]WPV25927.1 hypothetical protein CLAFUW7_03392 [Fulvia fulva]
MDTSPLGRLAGELRNRIYEYALHEPDGIPFALDTIELISSRDADTKLIRAETYQYHRPAALGVLLSCDSIYNEARGIYYTINFLSLRYHRGTTFNTSVFHDKLSRPCLQISSRDLAAVRDVKVMYGSILDMRYSKSGLESVAVFIMRNMPIANVTFVFWSWRAEHWRENYDKPLPVIQLGTDGLHKTKEQLDRYRSEMAHHWWEARSPARDLKERDMLENFVEALKEL